MESHGPQTDNNVSRKGDEIDICDPIAQTITNAQNAEVHKNEVGTCVEKFCYVGGDVVVLEGFHKSVPGHDNRFWVWALPLRTNSRYYSPSRQGFDSRDMGAMERESVCTYLVWMPQMPFRASR